MKKKTSSVDPGPDYVAVECVVLSAGRFKVGGNPWMRIDTVLGVYDVIRQAALGIWAFKGRESLSALDAKRFDEMCDRAWARLEEV